MNAPNSLLLTPDKMALATDFYQLTMMYAYFTADMDTEATFELFVRRLPKKRRFMVAAGLEQALAYLTSLRFSGEDIDFLRNTPTFANVADPSKREMYFERLRDLRFNAHVRAIPEGTIFFPNEPILQITGSLLEGQLVETTLLALLNFQTLIASKAARMRITAGERSLIDFGFRRAHGPQAAVYAARAAYVGGFDGTSDVFAAKELNIPVTGTAAHAYTMAFQREQDAFAHYLDTYPDSTVLLIDTYDTLRGARRATALGEAIRGVRLDSGDLAALAIEVRKILDEAGLHETKIIASSDLNEYKIESIIKKSSPIDTFGVGTELVTSKDDPTLAGVYKLVSKLHNGQHIPTMKMSSSKNTYPGAKDAWRITTSDGFIHSGALTQTTETPPAPLDGGTVTPLLQPIMDSGKLLHPLPSLADIRTRTLSQLETLPPSLRHIHEDPPYTAPHLNISPGTQEAMRACQTRFQDEANA